MTVDITLRMTLSDQVHLSELPYLLRELVRCSALMAEVKTIEVKAVDAEEGDPSWDGERSSR